MRIDRKTGLVVVLAAVLLSGAKKDEPDALTPEAAAAFGQLDASALGGALVLDADALRRLGFLKGEAQGEEAGFLTDLAADALPAMATELKDEAAAGLMARSAVMLRLLGDTTRAPEVRRIGVLFRLDPKHPDQPTDEALLLLAVKQGEKENRELMAGLGAAVRAAAGRDLVRSRQGDLCSAREAAPDLPFQLCVRAGPGLLAVGTPRGLAALGGNAPPASSVPGPIVSLRGLFPKVGRIEFTAEGIGAIRISSLMEPDDPKAVDGLLKGLNDGLRGIDARSAKQRAVMAKALEQVQGSLAKDPDAPARLKGAAGAATVDKVVDPHGDYAALRKSIKVARQGGVVTAELTIPAGQVQRASRMQANMISVGFAGILAAIAIPNYVKYQCRAKSSEGKVVLDAAWTAMAKQYTASGKYPTRLGELQPGRPPGTTAAICMPSGCAPKTGKVATDACQAAFADMGAGPTTPALCAVTLPSGDRHPDVWVKDGAAQPVHLKSACE